MTLPDPTAAAALDLIVTSQQQPATACSYVGTERAGVLAELEALEPPWQETLQVVEEDGVVVAAACGDWDEETGRAWIHGPWTRDPDAWQRHARTMLDAVVALTPTAVDDYEISAAPAHTAMADLARRLGWHTSDVNYAYVARSAEGWPEDETGVRPATADDLDRIGALHDAEFPGTYATARALLADADRVTLVLEHEGRFAGYASAEVKPDGEGYLDFIAVAEGCRGRGLSRPLLAAIGRRMLAGSETASVNLTVKQGNHPAVALYERFGFVRDAELVGYRSRPYS